MIYNEDCREAIKKLNTNAYDLVILDPPFGKCTKAKWDDKTFKLSAEFLSQLYRVMSDKGSLYIHCGMGEKSISLINWFLSFSKSNFHFKDLITWKKTRGIGMRKGWLQTSENILWYVKDNKRFTWNVDKQYSNEKRPFNIVKRGGALVNKSEYKRYTNVWDIPEIGFGVSPKGFKKIKSQISHLTPKNPRISDRMINLHCNKDSKVLIPFAGSGMEILSCIYNEVDYDAIEIDIKNVDFINSSTLKYEDFIKPV